MPVNRGKRNLLNGRKNRARPSERKDKRGGQGFFLDRPFCLLTLEPHPHGKTAFEIVGVRPMSICLSHMKKIFLAFRWWGLNSRNQNRLVVNERRRERVYKRTAEVNGTCFGKGGARERADDAFYDYGIKNVGAKRTLLRHGGATHAISEHESVAGFCPDILKVNTILLPLSPSS